MISWIIAILIPLTVNAYTKTPESECTWVDLRNEALGSVRNQGEIYWCYAFTAADVLQHTFNIKEKISAADLAINYNSSTPGRIVDIFTNHGPPHQTGFNAVTFIRGMKEGYCPEKVLPSEKWTKVIQGVEEEVLMSQAVKDIFSLIKIKKSLNADNLPFYYKFKNVGKNEFLSLIKNNNPRVFYSQLRNLVCQNDRIPFEKILKVKMLPRGSDIFTTINNQLSSGHLVSVDYDARILVNKHHRGISLNELHTSGIVGRRWNSEKKSCEFLIRDSYGEQCTDYDPSYDCEDGYVWLNELLIYPNLTSIVFLLKELR